MLEMFYGTRYTIYDIYNIRYNVDGGIQERCSLSAAWIIKNNWVEFAV